ncbi:MAG: hypothetical protein GTO41_29130 [Burkholderiales bacterium]|nr:hypothetical protein [Burkholderiales bacterium]
MVHVRDKLMVGFVAGFCSICSNAGDYPIAGLTPWERPAGAPVITQVDHGSAWFRRALTGISRPYPSSLRFLDDQGNWHTPFNNPGATGRYDIRGWYQPDNATAPSK